jgi:glutathione S-transferase
MPWRGRGYDRRYVRGRCDESKNKLAAEFNDGLRRLLANLSYHLHGFRYSLADFYGFANATFANPSAAYVRYQSSPCMYL